MESEQVCTLKIYLEHQKPMYSQDSIASVLNWAQEDRETQSVMTTNLPICITD